MSLHQFSAFFFSWRARPNQKNKKKERRRRRRRNKCHLHTFYYVVIFAGTDDRLYRWQNLYMYILLKGNAPYCLLYGGSIEIVREYNIFNISHCRLNECMHCSASSYLCKIRLLWKWSNRNDYANIKCKNAHTHIHIHEENK